jgi:hypothetical protein
MALSDFYCIHTQVSENDANVGGAETSIAA